MCNNSRIGSFGWESWKRWRKVGDRRLTIMEKMERWGFKVS